MLIKVTQEHIDRGIKGSAYHCPIALACGDFGMTKPGVGTHYVHPNSTWGGGTYYILPPIARRLLLEFDVGQPVAPFEFDL